MLGVLWVLQHPKQEYLQGRTAARSMQRIMLEVLTQRLHRCLSDHGDHVKEVNEGQDHEVKGHWQCADLSERGRWMFRGCRVMSSRIEGSLRIEWQAKSGIGIHQELDCGLGREGMIPKDTTQNTAKSTMLSTTAL